MFDSIYTAYVTPRQFFLMAAVCLASGLIYAWLMSLRVRSAKRFFHVTALTTKGIRALTMKKRFVERTRKLMIQE